MLTNTPTKSHSETLQTNRGGAQQRKLGSLGGAGAGPNGNVPSGKATEQCLAGKTGECFRGPLNER